MLWIEMTKEGFLGGNHCNFCRRSARTIQRLWQARWAVVNAKATMIQAATRRWLLQRRYLLQRAAVFKLQVVDPVALL